MLHAQLTQFANLVMKRIFWLFVIHGLSYASNNISSNIPIVKEDNNYNCSMSISQWNTMVTTINVVMIIITVFTCCYARHCKKNKVNKSRHSLRRMPMESSSNISSNISLKQSLFTGIAIEMPTNQNENENENGNGNNEVTKTSDSCDDDAGDIPYLSWYNIKYSIQKKKSLKIILDDISGWCKSGTLTAIIGASGCGKTSFLNALSKHLVHVKGGQLTGNLFVHNIERNKLRNRTFLNLIGFVEQDDSLHSQLTVYETVMNAARFCSSKKATQVSIEHLVEDTLKVLDIYDVKDTKIGNEFHRGISGGERKRVGIAIEMVRSPSILFLDEPTSGLSGYQSLKLIKLLKNICVLKGCTIITVLHQPRASIFNLLDSIMLLAKQGRLVYHGPAAESRDYFLQKGYAQNIYACTQNTNPANFLIDTLELLSHEEINILSDALKYDDKRKYNGRSGAALVDVNVLNILNDTTSICTQLSILLKRSFQQKIRNKRPLIIRALVNIFVPILLGIMFSELHGSIFDLYNALFMVSVSLAWGPLVSAKHFHAEKRIMIKEHRKRSYSIMTYYVAAILTELTMQLPFPIIFSVIMYLIMDFQHNFLPYVLVCILTNMTGVIGGLFCGAISKSSEGQIMISSLLTTTNVMFSGIIISVTKLPIYIRWLADIQIIRWSYAALSINEFQGETFECSSVDQLGCLLEGQPVLTLLELDHLTFKFAASMLGMVFIGFLSSAFLALKITTPKYSEFVND